MTAPEHLDPAPPPIHPDQLLDPATWTPRIEVDAVDQRRWTVALRELLALGNIVVLMLAGIWSSVCLCIGWCTAIFTGRLPDWVHDFLARYLEADVRLNGYLLLLTDRRPPFGLTAPADYPLRFTAPPNTRQSRLSLVFRFPLVIPTMIVTSLTTTGWWVLAVVHWVIVLIRKQHPAAIQQASASILRLRAGYLAYALLLTNDRYPLRELYSVAERDSSRHPLRSGAGIAISVYLVLGLLTTVVQVHQYFSMITVAEQQYALAQGALAAAGTGTSPDQGPSGATPAPTAVDPTAPDVSSQAHWQQLLVHIPPPLRPSCHTWTGGTVGSATGVTAAIECDLQQTQGIPDAVYYYGYADQASLDNAFLQMTLTQRNAMAQGPDQCTQGTPAAGPYRADQGGGPSFSHIALTSTVDGFVACGRAADNRTFVDTTNNRTLTLGIADLFNYWARTTFLN
jgi:hypothetical protein